MNARCEAGKQHWTRWKDVRWMIIGMLTVTGYYRGNGLVSPSSLYKQYSTSRIHVVGERRLTKSQANAWPEIWSSMSKKSQQKEKQHWAEEKPKIDSERKLRGIYWVDSDDKEFSETLTNRERSWKCYAFCNAA